MFGGFGLYKDETFFGIIFNGQLFFKTDPATRSRYVEMGMKPFQPNEKQILKRYYGVPADVMEDRDRLITWALDAVGAHTRKNRS
jgi:DNA transformation protein